MIADAEKVYVRVRVEDGVKSYWPKMGLDWKWGGLASDAVSVAWADGKGGVKRIWVLPFGPKGAELWTNGGVGTGGGRGGGGQTALERLPEKTGVSAIVDARTEGYTVVVALPRGLLFGGRRDVRMNISVSNNDEGAETWVRSWAKEEGGPEGWGLVTVETPATTVPATQPRRAVVQP